MTSTELHRWKATPIEAVEIQRSLAHRVDVRTPLPKWNVVAGADVSYNKFDPRLFASIVLFRVSDDAVIETADVEMHATFPYVPGLLSFREAPAILEAFAKLRTRPDVVMFDGHGIAHPRRLGVASHVGLWLKIPTIGCAKSRLCGVFREPGKNAGAMSALRHEKEQVGYVLRTKTGVRPLFVSAGHMIDLATAVRVVMSTIRGYRLPEPTRRAHLRVNELRRTAACSTATPFV